MLDTDTYSGIYPHSPFSTNKCIINEFMFGKFHCCLNSKLILNLLKEPWSQTFHYSFTINSQWWKCPILCLFVMLSSYVQLFAHVQLYKARLYSPKFEVRHLSWGGYVRYWRFHHWGTDYVTRVWDQLANGTICLGPVFHVLISYYIEEPKKFFHLAFLSLNFLLSAVSFVWH